MPEVADPPSSQAPAEQEHSVTPDYVGSLMDDVFRSVGGDVSEEKKPSKEEPEVAPEQEPEPKVEPAEPEVKPEDKKDPDPEPEPELDDDDRKSQETWQRYKRGFKEAEKLKRETIPGLQKQVEEFEGTRTELESLKKQLSEAKQERESIEHELYKGRVTASRIFQERVNKPFVNIEAAAKQLAKDNQLDPGQLMDVLIKGDKASFKQFISNLDEFDRADAHTMFKDMRIVEHNRDQLLQDARSVAEREAMEARQQSEMTSQQIIQSRQAAVGEIVPGFTKNIISLLPEDKRPDLHKISEEVMNFDKWEERLKIYGGFSAIVLPDLIDDNKSLKSQLKDAQSEISKLRKGGPRATGGSPASSKDKAEPEKISVDTSYDDFAQKSAKRIMESVGYIR